MTIVVSCLQDAANEYSLLLYNHLSNSFTMAQLRMGVMLAYIINYWNLAQYEALYACKYIDSTQYPGETISLLDIPNHCPTVSKMLIVFPGY